MKRRGIGAGGRGYSTGTGTGTRTVASDMVCSTITPVSTGERKKDHRYGADRCHQ